MITDAVNPVVLSYKALYNQYSKAMYNTCLRIVNNKADAEDILQEAFVDAFKGLEGFQSRSTFGAWMKRIVINKSINKIKRQKQNWIDLEKTDAYLIPDKESDDEEEMEFKVEEIKKAIGLLPNGYRTVFCLRLLEGCSFEEIADTLKISVNTVRSQYIRAKRKLKEIIKERNTI